MRHFIQDKLSDAQIAFINSGVSGTATYAYVEKTSTYTVTSVDYTVNCISGTYSINLPTAIGISGKIYVITNTGTGVITLDAFSTQTIQGDLTQTIYQDESFMIQSTGANWIVI